MKRKFFFIFMAFLIADQTFAVFFNYTPYSGILKEIKTDHFIVVFPEQYEDFGRKVATYAEEVHKTITEFFQWKPIFRTTIIISDEDDVPNGVATSALRNTIILYMSQPECSIELEQSPDSLYNLICHEYTHILHLDQIRGDAWFWRGAFGKLYIPNSGSFTWNLEGMATFSESKFGNTGRLRSAYNYAIIADAAANRMIPSYRELLSPYKNAPFGQAVYHFGACFLEYLYKTYGEQKFQQMFVDISTEFWPFVLRFVMNFKKIYHKSLDELWEEWSEYEYEKYRSENIQNIPLKRLTTTKSLTKCFDIDENSGMIYYYANGIKTDSFIYQSKIDIPDNAQKLKYSIINDIAVSDGMLFYVKQHYSVDNKNRNNIFVYDMKRKLEHKLTSSARIQRIAVFGNKIAYTRSLPDSCQLHIAEFDGKRLINDKILNTPNGKHIESIAFSPDGNRLATVLKKTFGYKSILIYDNNGEPTEIIENIDCKSVSWLDNQTLGFLFTKHSNNNVCTYNLETGEFKTLLENGNVHPFMLKFACGQMFLGCYTYNGLDIFCSDIPDGETTDIAEVYHRDNGCFDGTDDSRFDEHGMLRIDNLVPNKATPFHFGRYLYPTVWYILPTTLNSTFYSIPFIGPKLWVLMESPTGRFSYNASITYDYIKQYPENDLTLTFNLPCTTVTATWSNWAGGLVIYNGKFHESTKINGHFPICFSDSLSVNSNFPIYDYGMLGFSARVNHNFYEQNFHNTMTFFQSFYYQYIIARSGSSRADRGIYFELDFFQMPQKILNNNKMWNGGLYLANLKLQMMIPFKNVYYFGLLQAGSEIPTNSQSAWKNAYWVNSSLYSLLKSVPSILGNTSLNVIDGKAFGSTFGPTKSHGGFAYISFDSGFDITLYNKPIYWHFATLGFRELFMRVYDQYIYIFAAKPAFANFFVDTVVELAAKFFVGYDRYCVELATGAAIGYQGTAKVPNYSIFFSCNFTIGG